MKTIDENKIGVFISEIKSAIIHRNRAGAMLLLSNLYTYIYGQEPKPQEVERPASWRITGAKKHLYRLEWK